MSMTSHVFDKEPFQAPSQQDRRFLLKLFALIEVLTFISLSMMAALWAQSWISPGLVETLGLASGGAPDFLASALAMAKGFGVQYGVLLALIVLAGFVGRHRPARGYGISRGGHSLVWLVGLGVGAGLVLSILTQSVFVARELWDLGPGTAIWAIAEREPWDWTFWVFMGVGSYALIPIIEELAWRGYVNGRLVEHFKPGAALVVSTLFFSGWHLQYFIDPDLSKLMVIVSLVVCAVVFGLITLKTGSIWPAMIAHAIVNTPADLVFGLAKIALGVLVLIIWRRQVGAWLRLLLSWLFVLDVVLVFGLAAVIGGSVYALMTLGFQLPVLLGGGLVLALLGNRLSRAAW